MLLGIGGLNRMESQDIGTRVRSDADILVRIAPYPDLADKNIRAPVPHLALSHVGCVNLA